MGLFRRFVLRDAAEAVELGIDPGEYWRIWWQTVVLMLAVALIPLGVMTLVNYYLYATGLRSDLRHQVSEDLSNISGFLEHVVEERVAALRFLAGENDVTTMQKADLVQAYENLQAAFGGLVDLGIIGPDGTQVAYVGPYDIEGDNYSQEEWFYEVRRRDVVVSDVFMGHRRLPHFVVVVRSGDHLVRATMDMELLSRRVFLPSMGPADDVFLLNRSGVLQTDSHLHGGILSATTLSIPPYSPAPRVYEGAEDGAAKILGCSYISNSPFILIVARGFDSAFVTWLRDSTLIATFLLLSILLIVLAVLSSATVTVRHIHSADVHRAHILMGIERTSKMATIGRLAASVAHEINNPIAVINEKAGLLIDLIGPDKDFPHKEKFIGNLRSITAMVERCGSITHRLLGFTRRLKLRRERVDLRKLGTDLLGFLEKEALHRNIDIVMTVEDEVPEIITDPGQLEEILLNLLNNATAAVEEGGRIDLHITRPRYDQVALAVEDNGCGIAPEALSQIFEPFYSTSVDFGSGLGLCITQDLVQKLGGRIEVQSEVGEGTSFVVYLPLNADTSIE